MTTTATRQDLYTTVTDQMIELMEQGVRPWTQSWQAEHAAGPIKRPLRSTFAPYQGVNILILWAAALKRNFTAPIWMTYRQAKKLGAQVRKGEKGQRIVFSKTVRKHEEDEDTGETIERRFGFLKSYTVFNIEQIDDLSEPYVGGMPEPILDTEARIANAEAFFQNINATIEYGGDRACYRPSDDTIHMPAFEFFYDPAHFYSTLGHELVHWTPHPDRLDRDIGHRQLDKEGYAREELVAELGAAFLAAELNLALATREDHAAYLDHWLQVLKNDKRAIFAAAAHAQRAVDYLRGFQS